MLNSRNQLSYGYEVHGYGNLKISINNKLLKEKKSKMLAFSIAG